MKVWAFIVFLLTTGWVGGQTQTTKLNKKVSTGLHYQYVYIPTLFDQSVLNDSLPVDTERFEILHVNLYFSNNKSNPQFNQRALNDRRIKALKNQFTVFQDSLIEWQETEQTACEDAATCEGLFHGFEIKIFEKPGKDLLKKEQQLLDSLLAFLKADSIATQKDELTPLLYKSKWDDKRGWVIDSTTAYRPNMKKIVPPRFDSLIWNVMSRNTWENKVYVVDVTGSMLQYTSGLIVYLSEEGNWLKEERFVLFNDGDDKHTKKKMPGSTGGIYKYAGKDVGTLAKVMKKAMRYTGGDCQENDVEGAIAGQRFEGKVDHIVLIADGQSPIRDMSLVPNMKKPVHVVVCGDVNGLFNPQYLKLALRTKGTIHTNNQDIDMSQPVFDGYTVEIGKTTYRWVEESQQFAIAAFKG